MKRLLCLLIGHQWVPYPLRTAHGYCERCAALDWKPGWER